MECYPRKFVTRNGQEFTINIALPEDLDEVTEFMQLHFFSTSPICYLVQNHQRRHNFKDYLFGYLRQLVSLMVRDSTSRLAGITINGLEEQTDVVVSSEAKSTTAVPNLGRLSNEFFFNFSAKHLLSCTSEFLHRKDN